LLKQFEYLTTNKQKKIIISNLLAYYKQFSVAINKQLDKARTSVEKELKEFIAIQRWKDINFYARKEASKYVV